MKDNDRILVEIEDLTINFYTYHGVVKAINGVDFTIKKGETFGLVGETGCGKSVTARAIMKLIMSPPGKIEEGNIYFMEPQEVREKRKRFRNDAQKWYQKLPLDERKRVAERFTPRLIGFKRRVKKLTDKDFQQLSPPMRAPNLLISSYLKNKAKKTKTKDLTTIDAFNQKYDLLNKSDQYMQKIRGRFISMIFQEPMSALNPVLTVGNQIAEGIFLHQKKELAKKNLERIDSDNKLYRSVKRPRKVMKKVRECEKCGNPVSDKDFTCMKCLVKLSKRKKGFKSWFQQQKIKSRMNPQKASFSLIFFILATAAITILVARNELLFIPQKMSVVGILSALISALFTMVLLILRWPDNGKQMLKWIIGGYIVAFLITISAFAIVPIWEDYWTLLTPPSIQFETIFNWFTASLIAAASVTFLFSLLAKRLSRKGTRFNVRKMILKRGIESLYGAFIATFAFAWIEIAPSEKLLLYGGVTAFFIVLLMVYLLIPFGNLTIIRKFNCSICNADVERRDIHCDNCDVFFRGVISWRLYKIFINRNAKILKNILKNPDSRYVRLMEKVPIIRRFKKELYSEALMKSESMLKVVRIPDPKAVLNRYPHELSGGMQQRVMIATALSSTPQLLIADEPTTALDVTIQAQILKLMKDLKASFGSSVLLITHNLGVVAETCDRVGVMYAGSMAEIADVRTIFKSPLHPYTLALLRSLPSIQKESGRLFTIRGSVPNLIHPPTGCRFHPRCDFTKDICKKEKPELVEIDKDHFVACHKITGAKGYV